MQLVTAGGAREQEATLSGASKSTVSIPTQREALRTRPAKDIRLPAFSKKKGQIARYGHFSGKEKPRQVLRGLSAILGWLAL